MRPPCEVPRVLGGRDRAAGERVGVAPRRVVDGDEAVESIALGGTRDDVGFPRRPVVALGGLRPTGSRPRRPSSRWRARGRSGPPAGARACAPRCVRCAGSSDRPAARSRRRGAPAVGRERLRRRGRAAGEQRDREQRARCGGPAALLAFAVVCVPPVRSRRPRREARPPTSTSMAPASASRLAPDGLRRAARIAARRRRPPSPGLRGRGA